MRKRMIAMSLLLGMCAVPALAQNKANQAATSSQRIQRQIVEAQRQYERVIINLKNGKSVSGTILITDADDEAFTVIKQHEPFGTGKTVSVKYSAVASIEPRNPVVKTLKRVGIVPVVAALSVVILPTCLVSSLFHRPVGCPCPSGSMR
jgi:hypothetical protein